MDKTNSRIFEDRASYTVLHIKEMPFLYTEMTFVIIQHNILQSDEKYSSEMIRYVFSVYPDRGYGISLPVYRFYFLYFEMLSRYFRYDTEMSFV